jgi:DNA-binding transcriptional LysR family regulator
LAPFPLFTTDPSGAYYDLIRDFLEADGLPGPRLQPTGSVESVKRGVLAEANALGLLPAYAIADDVRTERVVALDVHPQPPSLRVAAIMSKVRPQHPASRELVESVRASYHVIARQKR